MSVGAELALLSVNSAVPAESVPLGAVLLKVVLAALANL